ncbi:hypothetical protein ACFLTT_00010 [Chloroflexota bacterium]
MVDNKQEVAKQAYDMLLALKNHIEQSIIHPFVSADYVGEFHSTLKMLERAGIDVSEFRIQDSERQPQTTENQTGGQRFSEEKYVAKIDFLAKIDATMNYLKS